MAGKRTFFTILAHRLTGRARGAVCRILGRHVVSGTDWGYAGGGMVDCYCPNCGQIADRVPLEDFQGMDHVIETVRDARAGVL